MNVMQAACFFNAESIVLWLRDRFRRDSENAKLLIEYQEPRAWNRALNFAVVNGNKKVIDILIKDFKSDVLYKNKMGLSILHCAAQYDRGILALFQLNAQHPNLSVNESDSYNCIPLHFAVLNKYFQQLLTTYR